MGHHWVSISVKRRTEGPLPEALHGSFVEARAEAMDHSYVVGNPVGPDFCGQRYAPFQANTKRISGV